MKVSFVFFIVMYLVLLVAGVLLWAFAVGTGTINNVENFIEQLFALDSFSFVGAQILRAIDHRWRAARHRGHLHDHRAGGAVQLDQRSRRRCALHGGRRAGAAARVAASARPRCRGPVIG